MAKRPKLFNGDEGQIMLGKLDSHIVKELDHI